MLDPSFLPGTSHTTRFNGAADDWKRLQAQKVANAKAAPKTKTAAKAKATPKAKAASKAAKAPTAKAAPETKAKPKAAAIAAEENIYGCSKCRFRETGCARCNPFKRARAWHRKLLTMDEKGQDSSDFTETSSEDEADESGESD